MLIRNLFSIAGGSAVAGTDNIKGRAVSELLFDHALLASVAEANLSAKLQFGDTNRAENIIESTPLRFFAERSDFFGGFSYGQDLSESALKTALAAAGGGAITYSPVLRPTYAVDLGHMVLSGDDDFEVTVTPQAAGLTTSATITVGSVEALNRKEELLRYTNNDPTKTAIAKLPREVWLYNGGSTLMPALSRGAALITLNTSDGKSTQCDVIDYWGYAAAKGRHETEAPVRAFPVWLEPWSNAPLESVSVKLTGASASDFRVIAVERIPMARRAAARAAELSAGRGARRQRLQQSGDGAALRYVNARGSGK